MNKICAGLSLLLSLFVLGSAPWVDSAFRLVESGSEREIQRAIESDYSFSSFTRSKENENLLMAALKASRNAGIINMILSQAKISPDAATKSGVTALMYACQYEDDIDAVKAVLYAGSANDRKKAGRILKRDKNGLTSFDYARRNESKKSEILALLNLFAIEPVGPQDDGETLPEDILTEVPAEIPAGGSLSFEEDFSPALSGTEDGGENEDMEAKPEDAGTPSGQNAVIDLKSLASPEPDYGSVHLYDYAANQLSDTMIPEGLILAGESARRLIADAGKPDSKGRTMLMKAAEKGDKNLIEDLLFSGAEIDAKDNEGWTALMYAARFQKDSDVTKLLLRRGADRSLKNKYGISPLMLAAAFSKNADVVSSMLESYPPDSDEVREALSYGIANSNDTKVLRPFIDKGAPLNVPYNGKTPLMTACQTNKNTKIIEWLLENGASKMQVEHSTGKTAFDYAKENRKLPHNAAYWSLNPNS